MDCEKDNSILRTCKTLIPVCFCSIIPWSKCFVKHFYAEFALIMRFLYGLRYKYKVMSRLMGRYPAS